MDYSKVQVGDLYFDIGLYFLEGFGERSPKDYLRTIKEVNSPDNGSHTLFAVTFQDQRTPAVISQTSLSRGGGSHGIFLRRNEKGKLEVIAASETVSKILISED